LTSPTTSLAQALARTCDSLIRQRGTSYFHGGRVRIKSGDAWRLVATVRGTSSYRVELAREGGEIHAACSCPYFDVAPCKHIWAAVLAADAQRLLRGNGDNADVHLLHPLWTEDDLDMGDTDDTAQSFMHGPPLPPAGAAGHAAVQPQRTVPNARTPPSWRKQLSRLRPTPPGAHPMAYPAAQGAAPGLQHASPREPLYVIDITGTRTGNGVSLEIFTRDRKKDGSWGKAKSGYLASDWLQRVPDAQDRQILTILAGARPLYGRTDAEYGASGFLPSATEQQLLPHRYRLREAQLELLLPLLCRTTRCRLRLQPQDLESEWLQASWDEGEPWQFAVEVRGRGAGADPEHYQVVGALTRGAERMELPAPLLLLHAGFLFTRERIARFEHHGAFDWVGLLREHPSIEVPAAQCDEFLTELLRQPRLPPLDLPEELRYEQLTGTPRPRLSIRTGRESWQRERLHGSLSFDYDGTVITADDCGCGIVQGPSPSGARRRVLLRDAAAEHAAGERLRRLGWTPRSNPTAGWPVLELAAMQLPSVVRELIAEGWHIEAEGKLYRSPDHIDVQVTSGIDWFELHGTVQFGSGAVAHLPALLAAARRGEHMVRLDDGSYGLLPQDWLRRYGLLAGLGHAHEDHLRFTRGQAGVLDALLSTQPEASCDALFARVREELIHFAGVHAAEPPAGFRGDLRPYQKQGLGWLRFLCSFGFGGCLADDMGLGKTVQVLALLEERREQRPRVGPSLVVVPKSLVFNWKQEAARFAPHLRVLDHTGMTRQRGSEHFDDYDLVLTTYGTLRRDAIDFKDRRFDYVILDEAQAIKNADSVSAKAARLLQADHRLALSGTPVENHLGELWSLFEFLNPGMLGTSSVFKLTQAAWRSPDEEARRLLSHILRPFLLRRTKEQVLPDLPPKVEQTLYCELDRKQRKLYDELRDHYRAALLQRVEHSGMGRSKIQILEALLRLRQAAIHPGLLDERRGGDASAKLDVLLPRLLEVLAEGHKTLVFSQFTSMLAILRQHLDAAGIEYAYLDGRTRDREARVMRFQTDPACKLFLISLKAGGHGLNLTAAQYVFLLDPWWNPAVEAQAIDRAHRIGQANRVFAYRLIARDTIEEKVLELQNVKRDLADAIVGADSGPIGSLSREELEQLLS
jgi:superfamily II DNA or RNA helicase